MAYAAKNAINKLIAVSFTLSELPTGDDIKHIEVLDTFAEKILAIVDDFPYLTIPDTPAFQRDKDLKVVEYLVKQVPINGTVIEIGSAFGGNAQFMLNVAPHIGSMVCIDPDWKTDQNIIIKQEWTQWIRDGFNIKDGTTSFEYASKLLAPYPQAKLYPLFSPQECEWWTGTVDMIFEDANHESETLRQNIEFWYPFVKTGGIISGHDYNDPNVSSEIIKIAEELKLELNVESTVWWMIKK